MIRDYDLAFLSAAIYEPLEVFERKIRPRGFVAVEGFSHCGTEASLVMAERGAVIVFRGTEASNWKLRDLYSNFTWPWPTVWQGAGRVHSGYRRHLNLVGFKALSFAEQIANGAPLYLTGHSLGGAIATLFASWYYHDNRGRREPYKLAGLVTWGAPKALDALAATSILCPIKRYVVQHDWAPHWPPLLGFGHPEKAIVLAPAPGFAGCLARHDVRGYCEAIRIQQD